MKSNFMIVALIFLVVSMLHAAGCDVSSAPAEAVEANQVEQALPDRLSIVSQDISVNRFNTVRVVRDSVTGSEFIVFTNSDGTFALPLTETNKKDLEIDLESKR
jgi:hypothetical protein